MVTSSGSSSVFCWLPVPARGDLGRGPLVPAYGLSYRDVEELMAERGVTVDHVTIYRLGRLLSAFAE